jgi:hypothetical protein
MPRVCTICYHPERIAIEAEIIARTPLRNIAERFSIGYVSVQRHATNHLVQAIKEVRQEQAIQSGSHALDRMAKGEKIVDEIVVYSWGGETGKEAKMPELALKALAEQRRQVELRAKIEGELDERSLTITAIPEWRELRTLLLEALALHPQAKMAVIRALEAYDHEQSA